VKVSSDRRLLAKIAGYRKQRAIALSLITALLLSFVDDGICQLYRTHNAYGQLLNAATTPPPTTYDNSFQTNSATPIQITLTGTDSIPGDVLKFAVVILPQHGTLTSGTIPNSVTYTLNTGFTGTDSFTYKATNGQGVESKISTVTMIVNEPPPTAYNESIETNSVAPVQIALTGTDSIA
jgi:Big-like domain-containing protein